MSYQALSRKYRPKTFEEVVGQNHIIRLLQNGIAANRLTAAYLFTGPRGIGKTSLARIFAKALNCERGPTTEPCEHCQSCTSTSASTNYDFLEIDGASNNSAEQIREIRDKIRSSPFRSRFKIYLIDEVHMLSNAAFNSLQKIIEEPPPHVKFLFATTESDQLPSTFTSRCQSLLLQPIGDEDIAQHLEKVATAESITFESGAAMILARAAKGGMRDAESMLEQLAAYGNGTISIRSISEIFSFIPPQETEELMGYILTGSLKEALTHLEKSHEKGQDAENILYDLAALANNLLLQETSVELEKPISPHQLANLTQTLSEVKVSMHGKTNKYPYVLTGVLQGIRDIHEASTEEVIKALQQQE